MANRFIKFISKYAPIYRRCPAGHLHRVSSDNPECGHLGKIIEWCEPQQRWVDNPTKTALAKEMIENEDEFAIEREARLRVEEELKKGNLKPALDFRRVLMNKDI